MIFTMDEANNKIEDIKYLSEKDLRELVEFLIKDGLVAKQNAHGASFEWSKATENIFMLIKHLIIKTLTLEKEGK